jgi:hypothetical protein
MLEDAMALAWAYEQWLSLVDESPGRTLVRSSAPRPATTTKLLAFPAPPVPLGATATVGSTTTPTPCLRRLSATVMAAKREKGECYNCFEKFSRAHLEVCPMKGIFWIEMDDALALETFDTMSPQISLNAITGMSSIETMKLQINILESTVVALINSGSMPSISSDVACHLHLEPLQRPSLYVTVANIDRVASVDICHDVYFTIDSEEFILDFFIIPLVGCDIVLRVH